MELVWKQSGIPYAPQRGDCPKFTISVLSRKYKFIDPSSITCAASEDALVTFLKASLKANSHELVNIFDGDRTPKFTPATLGLVFGGLLAEKRDGVIMFDNPENPELGHIIPFVYQPSNDTLNFFEKIDERIQVSSMPVGANVQFASDFLYSYGALNIISAIYIIKQLIMKGGKNCSKCGLPKVADDIEGGMKKEWRVKRRTPKQLEAEAAKKAQKYQDYLAIRNDLINVLGPMLDGFQHALDGIQAIPDDMERMSAFLDYLDASGFLGILVEGIENAEYLRKYIKGESDDAVDKIYERLIALRINFKNIQQSIEMPALKEPAGNPIVPLWKQKKEEGDDPSGQGRYKRKY